jgi:hypothetical protein
VLSHPEQRGHVRSSHPVHRLMSMHPSSKQALKAIAHDVMLQRGLLPDFSAAALNELKDVPGPAIVDDPATQLPFILRLRPFPCCRNVFQPTLHRWGKAPRELPS